MRDDTRHVPPRIAGHTAAGKPAQVSAVPNHLPADNCSGYTARNDVIREQVDDEALRELLKRFEQHPIRNWLPALTTAVTAVIDAHCLGAGVSLQPVQDFPRLRIVD